MGERVLPDDYPVYGGYWYVADGVPVRADPTTAETTVGRFKRATGASELRRCDAVARGLPLL